MHLPVRKCYHVAKIGTFLVIVVTLLSCFERWRGGRRTARAQFLNPEEEEYERQILEDEARIIPGLGEGGVAAHLVGEAKRLGEESEKQLAINVYLSDRIAYNRTLKDYRNPACKRVVYDAELPSTSVILIFHNEPYSVVVRTIWSVINSARRDQPWYTRANFVDRETGRTMTLGYPGQDPSSPFVYLKEIILVDDNSTLPELKGKLSHYIRTRLPPDLVRVVRLPDRVGLTQARMAGSRHASADVIVFLDSHCEVVVDWLRPLLQRIKDKRTAVLTPIIDMLEQDTFQVGLTQARLAGARFAVGDVLVFLDSHCEGQEDWLRPLLQRIKESPHAVVVPIIDVIESSDFYYSVQDPATFQVGGFTFTGHFTWIDVPEREKKRRGSDIAPTWSPTMAGGLFAMERAYFWELGAYDEQMAGWGGENLEMSFRVWQCGGTLETIPCSRVGHVFRSFHPYGLPANSDTHGINTARMAEVWMDDYAELFYLHRPDLRKNPSIGDVTHRRILRDKLQCKSFQWYLDNVYKEKFVPVRDVYGYGRFKNPWTGLCLDTMQREGPATPLGLYPCHSRLQPTQHLALSTTGELRDEERCAELHYSRKKLEDDEEGRKVLMVNCHGKSSRQKWRYLPTKQLRHLESGLCLTALREAGSDAVARRCGAEAAQRWDIDYSEDNGFGVNDKTELSEQELKLQRLRGRRRISRSLLSHSPRSHHHKRRKKNKFILKLVRGANSSEQHLEAELYCRHRRLLPNDTFVREIVSVLNDRDIKVINNGRIFEKNRVTELVKKHGVKEIKVLEKLELPEEPAEGADNVVKPKHWKSKKPKSQPDLVQPYEPGVPISSAVKPMSAGNLESSARVESSPDVEKKIIIEDFVEVKPSTDATVAPKRKQKKRKRNRQRPHVHKIVRVVPHADDTHAKQWEAPKRLENPESVEDSPLVSAELRKKAHSDETWRPESKASYKESVPRAAPVYTHEHAALPRVDVDNSVVDAETYTDYSVPRPGPTPAQLVVRSNLTFRLGDEFFRWRHAADDVANLLGELSIPVSSPPRSSDKRTKDRNEKGTEDVETFRNTQEDVEDTVLTGRGLRRESGSAKDADTSESSESEGGDS